MRAFNVPGIRCIRSIVTLPAANSRPQYSSCSCRPSPKHSRTSRPHPTRLLGVPHSPLRTLPSIISSRDNQPLGLFMLPPPIPLSSLSNSSHSPRGPPLRRHRHPVTYFERYALPLRRHFNSLLAGTPHRELHPGSCALGPTYVWKGPPRSPAARLHLGRAGLLLLR